MLDLETIAAIETLVRARHPHRAIARIVGVSRATVGAIANGTRPSLRQRRARSVARANRAYARALAQPGRR